MKTIDKNWNVIQCSNYCIPKKAEINIMTNLIVILNIIYIVQFYQLYVIGLNVTANIM